MPVCSVPKTLALGWIPLLAVITFFESHRYNEAVCDDQLVDTEKIVDVSAIVSAVSQPREYDVYDSDTCLCSW
jgi:hypothetical protein